MNIDDIEDQFAAESFRRLIRHLQKRSDVQNIDLMGLAGFCRNCLADWIVDASAHELPLESVQQAIYGMPYAEWKAQQPKATPEQLAKMDASLALNRAL